MYIHICNINKHEHRHIYRYPVLVLSLYSKTGHIFINEIDLSSMYPFWLFKFHNLIKGLRNCDIQSFLGGKSRSNYKTKLPIPRYIDQY